MEVANLRDQLLEVLDGKIAVEQLRSDAHFAVLSLFSAQSRSVIVSQSEEHAH